MCGFSRLTMRYGITHFLAMIRRLQTIVRPVIAAARRPRRQDRGRQRVRDASTTSRAALAAARAIQRSLDAANTFLPEDWDLHAGIGIGYGPMLLRRRATTCSASEMNLASKLGEDVAGRGEILLSSAARERALAESDATEIPVQLSGLTISAFRCA